VVEVKLAKRELLKSAPLNAAEPASGEKFGLVKLKGSASFTSAVVANLVLP